MPYIQASPWRAIGNKCFLWLEARIKALKSITTIQIRLKVFPGAFFGTPIRKPEELFEG
jgi:hypothetical protein